MAVRLVPAPQPAPHDDRLAWRLLKGQRQAEAVVRVLNFGLELRINVDDDLRLSQLVRGSDVLALARERREAFERLGWIVATND